MMDNEFLSISKFAQFSRTTRDTLLHYDKVGLLSPVFRKENKYRYYSGSQLAVINLIRTLQELGMSLEEIKHLKDKRTPEKMEELLAQQIKQIDEKIENWVESRKLLLTLRKSLHSVSDVDEHNITIQYLPQEYILLGDKNDYSNNRDDYDALLSFYDDMNKKYPDLNLNYPVWGVFSEQRIKNNDWKWPDHYYFYIPDGHDKRPAGLYAIGYTRGGYGQSNELYKRLIDYIDQNGFEICGDAYEEYPLNEVYVSDDAKYLMRIMITVREKNQPHS